MARDFSNPKKLGFMRVIQVFFAINVVITISLLVFMIKGSYTLGFADAIDYANLIFDGICFWLIWHRYRATRAFVIAFSLFNIVVGSAYSLATGTFDPVSQLISSSSDIVLLAYFLTSRRARAVLVHPFSDERARAQLDEHAGYFRPTTWGFWRNLVIYFCVFSVVGHWMEAGYCTLIRFGLIPGVYDPSSQIWSDWLYPFCVYGFGAVACVLLLFPVKNLLQRRFPGIAAPLALSFVANALVCTGIELAMGLMLNQPLPDGTLPLWDYRNMFCNFMGQVCLQNAVAFGFVATLMTWVIYPGLEKLLARVPSYAMNMAFIVVVIGFCILFFLYCVNVAVSDEDVIAATEQLIQSMNVDRSAPSGA